MHPTDPTLNDYVDGALTDSERGAVDAHLRDCVQCRRLIADLQEIRGTAKDLGSIEPSPRVWAHLDQALRESSVGGRPSAFPQSSSAGARKRLVSLDWRLTSLAAAAALVAAVFVGLRIGQSRRAEPPAAVEAGSVPSAQSIEAELQQAEEHYQKAIAGLEQIANANSGVFDPATAATLEKNLSVVDQAISESRAALRVQPNNEPAQASLLDSFKAKLALLQDTVSLINEMRKGDDAAAARIVSGLKRGT